jgi:hypothetical protein
LNAGPSPTTLDGGGVATAYVNQLGAQIPVISAAINSGLTLSLDHWDLEGDSTLVSTNNFNSFGHDSSLVGFDRTTGTLSGKHNIGQFVGLTNGTLVTLILGLCGPVSNTGNNPASIPQVAFFTFPAWIYNIKESVDAEGVPQISMQYKSNSAATLLYAGG